MGLVTLAQFREEITTILGDRAVMDADRLTRYVNFGYFDLTGAVEFMELEGEATVSIPGGQLSGTLPPGIRYITAVSHPSAGLLTFVEQAEWLRMRKVPGSIPTKWTQIGNSLKVAPGSGGGTTLTVITRRDPNTLEADSDVTELSKTWDLAIQYLAISHAFFGVNETSDGVTYFNRAVAYMKTRADIEGLKFREPTLGGVWPNASPVIPGGA